MAHDGKQWQWIHFSDCTFEKRAITSHLCFSFSVESVVLKAKESQRGKTCQADCTFVSSLRGASCWGCELALLDGARSMPYCGQLYLCGQSGAATPVPSPFSHSDAYQKPYLNPLKTPACPLSVLHRFKPFPTSALNSG
jgi:hypothetical protein